MCESEKECECVCACMCMRVCACPCGCACACVHECLLARVCMRMRVRLCMCVLCECVYAREGEQPGYAQLNMYKFNRAHWYKRVFEMSVKTELPLTERNTLS